MNECSAKEEQENKFFLSDALNLQLINICINGKYDQLKVFLEKYSPNKAEIDLAIRKCLYKFKSSDINYCKTLKELFKHADLNYCNPIFDNSNLLMNICAKSNTYIFDLIFEQNFRNDNETKKNKNKQNNKNNIKENNSYVDINLYHLDKNNNNLFNYLFNDMNNSKDIVEAITKIMNYNGNNNNKIYSLENKKYLFTQSNNDEITPIIIVLKKGFVNILTEIYKYIDYEKYEVPSTKNNLIHCAIEGKNIKCIKKMLSYSNSIEEIKSKNKEGYTPSSYAKKFGFSTIKKLIDEVEKNFDNKDYKDILLSIKDVDIYDILGKYMVIRNNCYITSNIDSIQSIIKKDYNYIIYNLKKYELDISIDEPNYSNLPCKWNILLSEIQMYQLLNYINNEKNKANIYNYLKQFSQFFKQELQKDENEQLIMLNIIFYNKIIYYYKLGNYSSLFDAIASYFKNIYGQNDNDEYNYCEYINYVTFTFILIEYFIFDNDKMLSNVLLNQLEKYLNNNIEYQSKYETNENIIKYLNQNEIFNPFNETWDDAYCLINLMRVLFILKFKIPFTSYKSIEESKKDKTKSEIREYLKIFEERNKNCEKDELVSSNRLKGLATINKCYYYYLTNVLNKSLKNLNLIKESLYNLNEYKIFYFNTLGIINLKQKKYKISEYLFKIGILLFNEATIHNSGEDKLFYNVDYVTKMKYNLCLSLFYNKKYYEAYLLFQEIQNNIIIKNNPFFWCRYGLTALNIYLINLKKLNIEKKKEKIQEEEEYKNIIFNDQSPKINNNDEIKYNKDISDKDDFDMNDLFIEFEKYCEEERKNSNDDKIKNINIKRIFFPKYNQINKSVSNNIKEYLITSINCFKKSIMLYKRKPYTIKRNDKMINDIKFILGFYKIENKNISNNADSFYNFNDLNISQISLFSLSYMNLLFCLSLNERFNEVLLLIKVFPPNLLNNNIDINNKLDYFKLNAMLNLKKYKEAEKIINKEKENINISDINYAKNELHCFNASVCDMEYKINHESYLILAEIYLDCGLKRYDKAEKNLNKLIKMVKYDKRSEISKYYNQLMLYILSQENKRNRIVNLIKYRWNQIQNREKNKFIEYKNGDKNG